MLETGFFIVFEGVDGSGKTTQAEILYNKLKKIVGEDKILLTKEPSNDTDLSDTLRTILKTKKLSLSTQFLLMLADRANHYEKIIKPALEAKKIVICDRFIDSTIVYQGMRLNLESLLKNKNIGTIEFSKLLNNFSTEKQLPDFTIWLDATIETVQNNLNKDNRVSFDVWDSDYSLLTEIIVNYKYYYDVYTRNRTDINKIVVDNKSIEQVSEEILNLVIYGSSNLPSDNPSYHDYNNDFLSYLSQTSGECFNSILDRKEIKDLFKWK